MNKTKIIILTGGVYSSLGKGIIASSIGRILKEIGYSVSIMKFDPYLNIDPSQLDPKEHGEIFVTKDGAKTDLDIGNYERFVGTDMNKYSSICSGLIYQEIIQNQINNKYKGQTIQVIPHVTDKIIEKIYDNTNNNKTDFLIIEIGGTIGDIESIPFYESITRFVYKYGKENILFAHCVPILSNNVSSNEIKTKPAQHSIKELRSVGITPELLFLRSENKIEDNHIEKISNIVLIKKEKIFNAFNVDSTYFVVNELYKQNINKVILEYFNLKNKNNISNWVKFTNSIKKSSESKKEKKILIIGGYVSLKDAYFSVIESLRLAAYKYGLKINLDWKDVNELSIKDKSEIYRYDGIINGGYKDIDLKKNRELFKILESYNKPIINYGLGFLNLIDYLVEKDKQIIDSDPSFIGEIDAKIINKNFDLNDYKIRRLSKELINIKTMDNNNNNEFIIVSKFDDKYIDLIINKNNKNFISISSNPEYSSKPNDINIFYDKFMSLLK